MHAINRSLETVCLQNNTRFCRHIWLLEACVWKIDIEMRAACVAIRCFRRGAYTETHFINEICIETVDYLNLNKIKLLLCHLI
jgi:hypothetical protein